MYIRKKIYFRMNNQRKLKLLNRKKWHKIPAPSFYAFSLFYHHHPSECFLPRGYPNYIDYLFPFSTDWGWINTFMFLLKIKARKWVKYMSITRCSRQLMIPYCFQVVRVIVQLLLHLMLNFQVQRNIITIY